MQRLRRSLACLSAFVVLVNCAEFDDPYNYDYSYGDNNFHYDYPTGREVRKPLQAESRVADVDNHLTADRQVSDFNGYVLPLCCPEGQVSDPHKRCSSPPETWSWRPRLSGEPGAQFYYKGFPRCKKGEPVPIYQKEVLFDDLDAFVPRYIHPDYVPPNKYCITKVFDDTDEETCEMHQTKVYICVEEREEDPGLYWTAVAVAHLLLVLTLIAFFFIRDLRCLQGQYMICFLISLLLYNICLLPGSVLTLNISFVSCVSLGAVKYFFFCGVMLWFNVMCFDIWRTLKNRQDVGSRKRFLLYSIYTWVIGAVLTTVVLVLPYAAGKDKDGSLMETEGDKCKLRTDINMILQLVETILMIVNLVFLSLATSNTCKYTKFGNGLPRCDANFCLKQGWKLYLIMIVHTLIDVPDDILEIRVVDLWRYILIESVAIFAVFAYRKFVLKALYQCLCRRPCYPPDEESSAMPEKHQLTTMQ
ncbi:uncharacterized protein [Palaemon carinicauda]|uniref:uncharacterized protein n=1 Tax=Palaemon carinicauda TaxID=392227 RepID=UPI0035B67D0B